MKEDDRKRLLAMSNKDFDELMCRLHPSLFRNRGKPMSETCMCWGFACGQGWHPLLADLCDGLHYISAVTTINVVADQVKEKFGTLRFYWHGESRDDTVPSEHDAEMLDLVADALVDRAEHLSERTCEDCGSDDGHLFEVGKWWYVRCPECAGKIVAERRMAASPIVRKWVADGHWPETPGVSLFARQRLWVACREASWRVSCLRARISWRLHDKIRRKQAGG